MKDPIWDSYTIEELLIEFYAHQFEDNKEFRLKFEYELDLGADLVEDFVAWADRQIEKEVKIKHEQLGEAEGHIKFSPVDVLGDEE
jgi:hypothetical protein